MDLDCDCHYDYALLYILFLTKTWSRTNTKWL